jgi:hypothetical protein
MASPDGLPTNLLVHEWSIRSFNQPYSRTFVQPLWSLKKRQGSKSSVSSSRSDGVLPPKHSNCCSPQPSLFS